MTPLAVLVAVGCAAVLIFDGLTATASRQLGFNYVWGSIGSFAIYLFLGFRAATSGGYRNALVVGLVVGFVDATLGEMISAAIGPVRAPLLSPTLAYRVLVAVEVVGLTIVTSCVGALAARWATRVGQ